MERSRIRGLRHCMRLGGKKESAKMVVNTVFTKRLDKGIRERRECRLRARW